MENKERFIVTSLFNISLLLIFTTLFLFLYLSRLCRSFLASSNSFNSLKFYDAVEIATQMSAFCESFTSFKLNALFTFSDIVESREGTIYVCINFFPGLDMENGIAFRDLSDDYPVFELTDFFVEAIGILGHSRNLFEAHWAHIVIVAMVDVCFVI